MTKSVAYERFRNVLQGRAFQSEHPSACQIELTFACDLRCLHCYSDCFNNARDIRKEMSTAGILKLLDRLYAAGVLWLTLTGGDPLARHDFLKIYEYAVRKGFLVTVFTNATRISDRVVEVFEKFRPFKVEVTLNGSNRGVYESISQKRNSFKRSIGGLDRIKKARLPLRIKTLISSNNERDVDRLKKKIESYGVEFEPTVQITCRLNGDATPLKYRVPVDRLDGLSVSFDAASAAREHGLRARERGNGQKLFNCGACVSQVNVDPYGFMTLCTFYRHLKTDLKKESVRAAYLKMRDFVRNATFHAGSRCRGCDLGALCDNCPGRAFLETGDDEGGIGYQCELARWRKRKIDESKAIRR